MKARADIDNSSRSELKNVARQLPAHEADFGDGKRMISPSIGCMVAEAEHAGARGAMIVLLHDSLPLGLSAMLDIEACRGIEIQLAEIRRGLETEANDAAHAALRKAGGK